MVTTRSDRKWRSPIRSKSPGSTAISRGLRTNIILFINHDQSIPADSVCTVNPAIDPISRRQDCRLVVMVTSVQTVLVHLFVFFIFPSSRWSTVVLLNPWVKTVHQAHVLVNASALVSTHLTCSHRLYT